MHTKNYLTQRREDAKCSIVSYDGVCRGNPARTGTYDLRKHVLLLGVLASLREILPYSSLWELIRHARTRRFSELAGLAPLRVLFRSGAAPFIAASH